MNTKNKKQKQGRVVQKETLLKVIIIGARYETLILESLWLWFFSRVMNVNPNFGIHSSNSRVFFYG